MNIAESKMVDLLSELKERHACFAVKAEFEAEGTRTEELMRLKNICMKAKVSLDLKIGGCEAVRDMYDARVVGVGYLVAPMVETVFSLQKYLHAVDFAFPADERERVEFLVNIETIQAVENLNAMLKIPEISGLKGIVVGRVDLCGSMGLGRGSIDSDKIFEITRSIFTKAKAHKKICVLGGAISVDSLPFLRRLGPELLDRYETRKICFQCPQALGEDAAGGIIKAVEFELLWLRYKHSYYKTISEEDARRISMLEERKVKI